MTVRKASIMDTKDLEEFADTVKVAILESMSKEALVTPEVADEWAATHTVILRKKSIFRTVSERWFKTTDTGESREFILVVKKV